MLCVVSPAFNSEGEFDGFHVQFSRKEEVDQFEPTLPAAPYQVPFPISGALILIALRFPLWILETFFFVNVLMDF